MACKVPRMAGGVALLACLVALPCAAAQWHVVALHTESGATVSVDSSSVSSRDYIANGWIRVDYPAPRLKDGAKLTGYAAEWQANCQNRTYWANDAFGFRPAGMESIRLYNTSQEWQSPMPGGDEAVALDALCYASKSLMEKAIEKAGEIIDKAEAGLH